MTCLVLLPGMDGTGEFFSSFVTELPGEIKSMVVSYPRTEPLSYAQLEAYVRQRLPAHESYVLLGESFSGPVAIAIAASAPRNLTGLILCCTFAANPRPALAWLKHMVAVMPWFASAKWASPLLLGNDATPALLKLLYEILPTLSPAVVRMRLREIAGVNVTGALAKVSMPVLYLRAMQDRLVPKSAGEMICRVTPHAQVSDVEGPHMLLQTRSAETAGIVGEFMRRL